MAKEAKHVVAPAPSRSGTLAKRVRVSQTDVPAHSLTEALRVAYAIANEYGKQPTRPVDVATALQLMPNAGPFRMLTGAAVSYGLTDGGAYADLIGLTDLGRRIVAPIEEGDDVSAMREAVMRPRVIREFLQKYDGSSLPSDAIALNVLESLDVPRERAAKTYDLIVQSAEALGMLNDISGRKVVNLRATSTRLQAVPDETVEEDEEDDVDPAASQLAPVEPKGDPATVVPIPTEKAPNRKVFISHGSNKKIVEQLQELLSYGDFEPVVSVEKESTAKPVPRKVMGDMRLCGAGIIHVGTEKTIVDTDGTEHHMLNENVLIEIGAALALWVENYILLVEEGVKLPSNLQGLYEVRYEGTSLDATATMKLLKAFKEFKN